MNEPKSGGGRVRAIITAAVAAGLPAGLLFAAATYVIAMPLLLEAEVFETGLHAGHGAHPVHVVASTAGAGRLLWGLAGAVGMACGLALVLVPLVRAAGRAAGAGRPGWRVGAAVAALAYLAVFLLPGLVTLPVPPGVENAASLGARQGTWMLSLVLFAAAWGVAVWMRGRLARGGRGRAASVLGAGVAGALVWTLGMGLFLALTGFAPGPEPGPVPDEVVRRFAVAMALSNAVLYAALGGLMPPALRRFAP